MPVDHRTLLAGVLGVGLGLLLVAAPEAVVRAQMVGRVPGPRGGEYGEDGDPNRGVRLLVRAVGGLLVLAGLYFGYQALA